MKQDIIFADKGYRRKVLIIYFVFVSVTLVIIGWALPWAQEYLWSLDPRTALGVMKLALVVLYLSIVPMALYLLAFGRKILRHERFPPPGVKVISDTRLIQGAKAKVRGRTVVVLSLILIFLALFGALYTPYILHKLESQRGELTEFNYSLQRTLRSSLR